MTSITRLCNKCGKEVEFYNDFTLAYNYGYESKYDGKNLNLDLCGTCLDEFTTYLIENCKINPIIEDDCDAYERWY